MANLGHVSSTALTGEEAPVFEAATVTKVVKQTAKTNDEVQNLRTELAEMKELVAALVAAQAPVKEPVKEPTTRSRAKATDEVNEG